MLTWVRVYWIWMQFGKKKLDYTRSRLAAWKKLKASKRSFKHEREIKKICRDRAANGAPLMAEPFNRVLKERVTEPNKVLLRPLPHFAGLLVDLQSRKRLALDWGEPFNGFWQWLEAFAENEREREREERPYEMLPAIQQFASLVPAATFRRQFLGGGFRSDTRIIVSA